MRHRQKGLSVSVVASFGRDSVASGKVALNNDQGIFVPAIALNVAGRQRNDTPVAFHKREIGRFKLNSLRPRYRRKPF